MKVPALIISFFIAAAFAPLQREPIFYQIKNDHGLVDYPADTISKTEMLRSFFTRLSELKEGKRKKVSILHIGDSHIQADWLSGRVRELFQNEFGNAGRGLIFPAKAGKSNESYTFSSSSSGTWEFKRAVFPEQPLPIGLSGMTLNTADTTASIKIELKDYKNLLPYHRKLTFFYQKDSLSYFINLKDSLGRTTAFIGSYTREESPDINTVYLNKPSRFFTIQVLKTTPIQQRFMLYGINVENEKPGLIYHSVGVNGAKVRHFLAAEHFFRQTQSLQPDLVIISLGTNEVQEFPFQDPQYEEHWNNLINKLAEAHPGVPVLITTPPGHFKNKSKKNPGMETVLQTILSFSNSKSIPVFNLYEAGGGKYFANQWSKKGLLQSDGVHFTREGYELQGDMLYLALIQAYNRHAEH